MPLENDLEISGPVMTELYISSSSADRAFEVTLYEEIVSENVITTVPLPSFLVKNTELTETEETVTVTRNTVSSGALKATARARDSARSTDYLPVYSLVSETFVAPDQSTRLDIAMRQTAYRFKAGSRLVLEIKPANDGSLIDVPDEDILHHNIRSPSRVWLPVVQSPLSISRTLTETAQPVSDTEIPIAITIPETSIPDSTIESDVEISTEENQRFFVPR